MKLTLIDGSEKEYKGETFKACFVNIEENYNVRFKHCRLAYDPEFGDGYLLGFTTENLSQDDIDTILVYPGNVFPELLEEYGELGLFEENISKKELIAFLKYFVKDYRSKLDMMEDYFKSEIKELKKEIK
nr:hypothetical protein [Clostridioides sp.]